MKRRADREPGYVLHTYPYKETSLIEEAFTRRYGRIALLARDAPARRIGPERNYVYEPERGPRVVQGAAWADAGYGPPSGEVVVSGQTLLDVARDEYGRPETRGGARSLMRALIGQRLHGQVL